MAVKFELAVGVRGTRGAKLGGGRKQLGCYGWRWRGDKGRSKSALSVYFFNTFLVRILGIWWWWCFLIGGGWDTCVADFECWIKLERDGTYYSVQTYTREGRVNKFKGGQVVWLTQSNKWMNEWILKWWADGCCRFNTTGPSKLHLTVNTRQYRLPWL